MSTFICKEAIRWCLRQISYNDFIGLANIHRAFAQAVFKGGFTMNAKNYRSEAIVKRLVNMFYRRDDLTPIMFSFVSGVCRESEKMAVLSFASYPFGKSIEDVWRDKFASREDNRPLAMAFYHNSSMPRLSRLADLLLHIPSFWQNGKALPRGKAKAAQNVAEECGKQLAGLLTRRIEQKGGRNSVQRLTQPMIPGLLPLGDTTPVLPNLNAEKASAESKVVPEVSGVTSVEIPVVAQAVAEGPEEGATIGKEPSCENVQAQLNSNHEGAAIVAESQSNDAEDDSPVLKEVAKILENRELVPILKRTSGTEVNLADNLPAAKAKGDGDVARLREELAQARKRNGEMSRDNDQLRRKLRIQTELGEKEKAAHSRELEAARSQLDAVRDELEDAIDEIREGYEALHAQQMAAYYAEGLCVHPDQVAYLCETQKETQALRSRVESALSRQKKVDKNFGTVSELRHEEQQLDQMLTRVHLAIEESLSLCPELRSVERELTDKLAEVRSKLRKDADEGEIVLYGILPRMELYIKELPVRESTFRDFDELEKFLDTSLGRGLFSPEESKSIKERVEMRRRYVSRAIEAAKGIENVPDEKNSILGDRMEHIMKMSWYVDRLKEVELYIDAYNVIKRDPIMSIREKASNGFASVRNEFNERCRRISRLFKKVTVVYDGNLPTENLEKKGENFYVAYAAKREDGQNADNWIVDKLAELSEAEEAENIKRWIVTDDGGLLARVANFCDGYVDDATFVGFTQVRM